MGSSTQSARSSGVMASAFGNTSLMMKSMCVLIVRYRRATSTTDFRNTNSWIVSFW